MGKHVTFKLVLKIDAQFGSYHTLLWPSSMMVDMFSIYMSPENSSYY